MESGRRTGVMVAGAAEISAAIVALSIATFGPAAQGWLLAARYTARFSFVVFLVSFLGPRWLRGFDRELERDAILSFGAAHGIHLAVLVTYRVLVETIPPASGLIVGGLGYVFLGVLLFLIVRRKASNLFRSGSLHYLLLVFLLTYAMKIPTTDQRWPGLLGTAACVAAVVLRHAPIRERRPAEGTAL